MQVFTSLFSSTWRFECWSLDYKVTLNLNTLVDISIEHFEIMADRELK